MKHGDLANYAGTTIGFRCVDFVVKFREEGLKDDVLNFLIGKYSRAYINESVVSVMMYFYRKTEYNVDLVIERKDYTDKLKKLIEDLPFNRIVLVEKNYHVATRLAINDWSYYVDDNDERLAEIGSSYAMKLSDLSKHLKMNIGVER